MPTCASVDSGRVAAAVKEHRVQAFLDGVPMVMVQCGVVTAWAIYFWGGWSLAIALLVANAVGGFDWFGRVAGMVVTEAPGTRAWQQETSRFAGGADLMDLPPRVDLVSGEAPEPEPVRRVPLERLELSGFSAIHDDGTIGVSDVDLTVEAGELVLLVGQVGSGKSSLLSALAGLIEHSGVLLLERPGGHRPAGRSCGPRRSPTSPRCRGCCPAASPTTSCSATGGPFDDPVSAARLGRDIEEAGGKDALVGHRGVRLSGGQVQRLALARALAADAELLLADDVSSALDAATEIELWAALRERRTTVIGATAKRAALAQADRVVVLVERRGRRHRTLARARARVESPRRLAVVAGASQDIATLPVGELRDVALGDVVEGETEHERHERVGGVLVAGGAHRAALVAVALHGAYVTGSADDRAGASCRAGPQRSSCSWVAALVAVHRKTPNSRSSLTMVVASTKPTSANPAAASCSARRCLSNP